MITPVYDWEKLSSWLRNQELFAIKDEGNEISIFYKKLKVVIKKTFDELFETSFAIITYCVSEAYKTNFKKRIEYIDKETINLVSLLPIQYEIHDANSAYEIYVDRFCIEHILRLQEPCNELYLLYTDPKENQLFYYEPLQWVLATTPTPTQFSITKKNGELVYFSLITRYNNVPLTCFKSDGTIARFNETLPKFFYKDFEEKYQYMLYNKEKMEQFSQLEEGVLVSSNKDGIFYFKRITEHDKTRATLKSLYFQELIELPIDGLEVLFSETVEPNLLFDHEKAGFAIQKWTNKKYNTSFFSIAEPYFNEQREIEFKISYIHQIQKEFPFNEDILYSNQFQQIKRILEFAYRRDITVFEILLSLIVKTLTEPQQWLKIGLSSFSEHKLQQQLKNYKG